MLFAFLTTLLWATGAIAARRLVTELGSTLANLVRLVLATACLAVWAYVWGGGTAGPGFVWFFLSGCVGFGLGDVALYFALARVGARLTILLTQTLAAPIAALIEWAWLDTRLTTPELLLGGAVIGGVALALVPRDNAHLPPARLFSGILYGCLAACGQAGGAVLSRKAYDLTHAAGLEIDGGTAAFQRIIGGVAIALVAWLLLQTRPDEKPAAALWQAARSRRFYLVLGITALFGPVFGVACYQAALANTPSGLVLPIVALAPIVIIPFSYRLEGDRPRPRSLVGAVIAVAAGIALALHR